MIVLKNLARELDMNTHRMRIILREAKIKPKGGRYKWENEKDPHYIKSRKALINGRKKT